jgi:DnaJ-class molecular chaperone
VLDISNSAEASEVKLHYFRLAKQFHPDKFHHLAGSDTHSRLQTAFNRLSQAYETLKDVKSRELYDFKLKKEGIAAQADVSTLTPEQVFKQGMEKIQQGGYNEGVALLTRAVQLAPNVAEYHARFGQALSVNQKFRHQAESELQTAVRLDEKNADWRMALINFYLGVGLSKRAENELKKLLAIHPNHADARQKLNNLR